MYSIRISMLSSCYVSRIDVVGWIAFGCSAASGFRTPSSSSFHARFLLRRHRCRQSSSGGGGESSTPFNSHAHHSFSPYFLNKKIHFNAQHDSNELQTQPSCLFLVLYFHRNILHVLSSYDIWSHKCNNVNVYINVLFWSFVINYKVLEIVQCSFCFIP